MFTDYSYFYNVSCIDITSFTKMNYKIVVWCLLLVCCAECRVPQKKRPPLPEGSPCTTKGRNGTCVSLYKCTSFATIGSYVVTGQYSALGNRSHVIADSCSKQKDADNIICCTDCELDETEYFKTIAVLQDGNEYKKPQNSTAYKKCLNYMLNLPYACRGVSKDSLTSHYDNVKKCSSITRNRGNQSNSDYVAFKDVGGYVGAKWQVPHMALLGYGPDRESAQWLCTGAVISQYFILTAANCAISSSREPVSFAVLGALTRKDVTDYWKTYKIKDVIVHPEYRAPSKYHDIALLQTVHEINFSKRLLPACLDVGMVDTSKGSVPSWGLGATGDLAENLMVADLHENDETLCSSIYPKSQNLRNGFDKTTQMCYSRQNESNGSCLGDIGDPLQTSIVCMNIVFGVTSLARDCRTSGHAGMYTRVRPYLPWIENIVWPAEIDST